MFYFYTNTHSIFFTPSNTSPTGESDKLKRFQTFSLKNFQLNCYFCYKNGFSSNNAHKRTCPVHICVFYSMIWILVSPQKTNRYILHTSCLAVDLAVLIHISKSLFLLFINYE